MARTPLKAQIQKKISRSWKRNVFLRKDFENLAGKERYDQIGRALLELTKSGYLIKIGYGLYAKARLNKLTGKPMLAAPGGFNQVAIEALNLLNVKWEPSKEELLYNQSTSTQIPTNTQVKIKSRFNRVIATNKFKLRMI